MNPSVNAGHPGVLLNVQGLSKKYGDREILRELDLIVESGEFVCIVGPSGAGKTTLLQCLSGLSAPTAGRVVLNGREIHETPPEMAIVFQDYSRSLMPWLSVLDNVTVALRSTKLNKQARHERAVAALTEVGLGDHLALYPWQMSGGMQQRAAIARALAYQPEIVLMDEPFASVDAQTRADLEDLTLALKNHLGITVVLVTHDIDEAVYLADRVVVLGNRPTQVVDIVEVELGAQRDQISTKADPKFSSLRSRVYRGIRGEAPTAADAVEG
ncbi:ABC transporter ATP-binding protein [Nocardioides sp. Iso805N]|uniref:ABC transporter ATP-binding protein n=1 Tax=Nocardioides sp. Iso805N TaxID=1283287 RepID=UPI0003632C21|nr:ABC transporter ATP-binding protein [Nocardioides sp. Iso805N]